MVHEKVALGRALTERYVDRGANLVAAPVIVTTSAWRGLKVGLYRATHWSQERPLAPAEPAAGQIAETGASHDPTRVA
jgi:hypothetical protein